MRNSTWKTVPLQVIMKRAASRSTKDKRPLKKQRTATLEKTKLKRAVLAMQETKMYFAANSTTGGDQFFNDGFTSNLGFPCYRPFPQNQGDGDNEYVGQRITPIYWKIQYNAYFNQANSTVPSTYSKCRAVLLQWKGQPPSTAFGPSVNDILQTGTSILSPISGWDFNNCDNIRILRVTNFTLDSFHPTFRGEFKVNARQLEKDTIRYIGTTGGVNDGGVYLYFISDSTYPSSAAPYVECYHQCFYKDA